MPSIDVGSEVFRNFALNCWPWVRSLIHSPDAVTHSPAEMIAACPIDRDQFAVAACLDPQNAEAVLVVVERDALDETRQHFLG